MPEAVKPFLTLEYLTLGLVLLGYLMAVLRWLAPRTKTTLDDRAVGLWDDFRVWLFRMAPFAWQISEDLARAGAIRKDDKRKEYFIRLEEAFRQAFNTRMPEDLKADADFIAAGKSAQEHLERGNIPPKEG